MTTIQSLDRRLDEIIAEARSCLEASRRYRKAEAREIQRQNDVARNRYLLAERGFPPMAE